MALDVDVKDSGSGNRLKIGDEGEITASLHTHPPIDETVASYPFRQFFKNDADSSNMIVSSTTDFFIEASPTRDIFIKTISLRIGDASSTLNLFGALSALSTGCALCFQNDVLGEIVIADELKTNLDLIRLATNTQGVGAGTTAYILGVQGGNAEDTYLTVMDMQAMFGFPWGLHLKKGSKDRIFFTINDDLTGLVTFNTIGYGIQI